MSVNRSKPDQYQLRFPPGLRDKLKSAADMRARSMNAEIVARLESSFIQPHDDKDTQAIRRGILVALDNEARLKDALTKAVAALDEGDVQKARDLLNVGVWFEPQREPAAQTATDESH